MLDENKSDIYRMLPKELVPVTIQVMGKEKISPEVLKKHDLIFPLIIKPNIGFRGYKVQKVDNLEEAQQFLDQQEPAREWLIQEYLDYDREFSVLYYRIPGSDLSGITSLVEKIYPFVQGDGRSTFQILLERYNNPFVDQDMVRKRWYTRFNWIPADGEKVILDRIGNYARGSKFYTLQSAIDDQLVKAMDRFFASINGLDFFRMDFKADNLEQFKKGHFKVLEINGTKSEPIHIYDPNCRFFTNVKTIIQHWITIRKVVHGRLHAENYSFPTTRYGLKSLFAIKKLVK